MPVVVIGLVVGLGVLTLALLGSKAARKPTLQRRLASFGLDTSRLDAAETETLGRMLQRWEALNGNGELLANDPDWLQGIVVLETNFTTEEILTALARAGIPVEP